MRIAALRVVPSVDSLMGDGHANHSVPIMREEN
jgi:hypothetical protein